MNMIDSSNNVPMQHNSYRNINQLISEINNRIKVLWKIVMVLVFILGMLISYIIFYIHPQNKQQTNTVIPITKYYSMNAFKFNKIG